jgi:gluconolactonase
MRCLVSLVALVLLPTFALAADVPAPSGSKLIVDPEAKWELLYTRTAPISGGLTEGPAVAPDGSIYFTDIPFGTDAGGLIVRFDPKTSATSIFSDDSGKANGLVFDAAGFLLACEGANGGGRKVSRWNVVTKQKYAVAETFGNKKFNAPNDICVDRNGRIYFTDPKYLGEEARELDKMSVYFVEPTGAVRLATADVTKPNGVAVSPDNRTLYVANHDNGSEDVTKPSTATPGPMAIYAFTLAADGSAIDKRTVIDFGDKKGCDGMTVDLRGNLYLTIREPSRPGVMVVDPKLGKEIAFIPTGPEGQSGDKVVGLPSNVEFGIGDEASTLYCTIDLTLQRIKVKSKGVAK